MWKGNSWREDGYSKEAWRVSRCSGDACSKGDGEKVVQWKSMKIKCDDVEMCEEDVQSEDEKQKKKTQIAYNLMEVLTIRR